MQENFDDSSHAQTNLLRGDHSEHNHINLPIHNVSAYLEGPAVQHIIHFFKQLWNSESIGDTRKPFENAILPLNPEPVKEGNIPVQILRTLPWNVFDEDPKGATEVLESYQRAFRHASEFIYLECQYFTEPKIVDALIFALESNPKLEIIILLNKTVDVPLYQSEQEKRLNDLLEKVKIRSYNERIGVFTAWSHETGATISRITPIYINSKLGIVDNKFFTVGSANLDGLSLINSQVPLFSGKDNRNSAIAMNIAVFSDIEGLPKNDFIDQARIKSWSEFLGVNEAELQYSMKPNGGWLSLWNRKAREKLHSLKTEPEKPNSSRILTYVAKEKTEEYLKELGVDTTKLQVGDTLSIYIYNKKKWTSA